MQVTDGFSLTSILMDEGAMSLWCAHSATH